MYSKYGDKFIQLGLNIAYYRKMRGFSQEALGKRLVSAERTSAILNADSIDVLSVSV